MVCAANAEEHALTFRTAFTWLLATTLTVFVATSAAAALDDALEAWLADNDYEALPALTNLARSGDVDAQLLLGVIAGRPHSPYVVNLPRSDRKNQLRAPGGLSGVSWLKVAADAGNLRAKALVSVQTPPFVSSGITTLVRLGEDGAAATAMLRAATYRRTDPNAAVFDRTYPADMAYAATVLKLSASRDIQQPGSRAVDALLHQLELAAVDAFLSRRPVSGPARDISLRLFPGNYSETNALPAGEFLLEIAPVSRPANRLRVYCEAACPRAVAACAGDAVALLGGYDQIWRFGPPINALISEDRYLASPRFHADMARHMKSRMEKWSLSLQAEWSAKSCAAESRFRSRFP